MKTSKKEHKTPTVAEDVNRTLIPIVIGAFLVAGILVITIAVVANEVLTSKIEEVLVSQSIEHTELLSQDS